MVLPGRRRRALPDRRYLVADGDGRHPADAAARRDDAETGFLVDYMENGILPFNPFTNIDQDGVGQLMAIAVGKGREVKPGLVCGICGEHGGDPQSITLCHQLGLDYVSCSPFRVPVARLAAAHAALNDPALQ